MEEDKDGESSKGINASLRESRSIISQNDGVIGNTDNTEN